MPIRPPHLDDRGFDDLVRELVARIPAHTPEWTDPAEGDPGRTLIELFAWLVDTLLYRANLIPERQRLAFLKLLDVGMRPARAATGLVEVFLGEDDATDALTLAPGAAVEGPAPFETLSELTVLPVRAAAYYKRRLSDDERDALGEVLEGLQSVYGLNEAPAAYVTTPVFAGGTVEPGGFDVVGSAADRALWLALLAPSAETVEEVRETLGGRDTPRQALLNVGLSPAIQVPELFEEIGPRAGLPHVWEMSTGREAEGEPEYVTLEVLSDGTDELTRRGVVRLALPGTDDIGIPDAGTGSVPAAGVGDRPPRLDDPEIRTRVAAWIRLRPTVPLEAMELSWIGVNAVEVDQRVTARNRLLGQSDGSADQEIQLPGTSVEPGTLVLEVEEEGRGFQPWLQVEDLNLAGRDTPAYRLDAEAGTIRFGDGIRGRVPEAGRRIRVGVMRAGGGARGNLPPGSLTGISARDLDGDPVTRKLEVRQSLPTQGGDDAETLAEAEKRIAGRLQHRERAVTARDYERLASEVPGVRVGRVEVLPRFKPQQRREGVPGVVSVMVLPHADGPRIPAPRADRPFLETVHAHLRERVPLATELYVIGCAYVPLGVGVGIRIRDGHGRDTVTRAVREALRRHLWALIPGGPEEAGWPLGAPVRDRELEVVAARVPGVSAVTGVNLFERREEGWRLLPRSDPFAPVELSLRPWELPELLALVVVAGPDADTPTDLKGVPDPFADREPRVAVPVIPEVC